MDMVEEEEQDQPPHFGLNAKILATLEDGEEISQIAIYQYIQYILRKVVEGGHGIGIYDGSPVALEDLDKDERARARLQKFKTQYKAWFFPLSFPGHYVLVYQSDGAWYFANSTHMFGNRTTLEKIFDIKARGMKALSVQEQSPVDNNCGIHLLQNLETALWAVHNGNDVQSALDILQDTGAGSIENAQTLRGALRWMLHHWADPRWSFATVKRAVEKTEPFMRILFTGQDKLTTEPVPKKTAGVAALQRIIKTTGNGNNLVLLPKTKQPPPTGLREWAEGLGKVSIATEMPDDSAQYNWIIDIVQGGFPTPGAPLRCKQHYVVLTRGRLLHSFEVNIFVHLYGLSLLPGMPQAFDEWFSMNVFQK